MSPVFTALIGTSVAHPSGSNRPAMNAPPLEPLPESPAARTGSALRWFGRLQLLRLLGKSTRTMAWQVSDPSRSRELMLVLPRVQPAHSAALELWQQGIRTASRLVHPQLAAVVESGVQDGWPFVLHELGDVAPLSDRLSPDGLSGREAAALATQCLQGLAFAHEAGVAHHDLQPYLLLLDERGRLRVAGLAVAQEVATADEPLRQLQSLDAAALRSRRLAAERDVLGCGIILQGLLTGLAALPHVDISQVLLNLPPEGREPMRLPWTLPQPIAEPLRAIVNRATDRQPRLRYRNARTLLRALEGWLQADSEADGGPLALLLDRLQTVGALPSSPGAAARAAKLAMMERERTNELAEVVLEDLALSFEMLRLANTAQVRGTQLAGAGPVLTVRRAIALLGLDGVRRGALALRNWPGPLDAEDAQDLQSLIDRCRHAGRTAVALRPAGYDAEVVFLITLLQNLGRLLLQYHFADEARQIHRLRESLPDGEGGRTEPGLSEEAACQAVLGVDAEQIAAAVARHWGLTDEVLLMVRRHPLATPVRSAEHDADILRATASCANEAVDAMSLPARLRIAALERVAQRYARLLQIGIDELNTALKAPLRGPLEGTTAVQPFRASVSDEAAA